MLCGVREVVDWQALTFLSNNRRLDLRQRKLVNITAVASIAAYLSTIIVILTKCVPIHRNWQVYPYPGGTSYESLPEGTHFRVDNTS